VPGFLRHITFKRKILILGLILILVPGAVISYLSLKSINDKAENLREKYKGTVSLVKDKLESAIFRKEANLRNAITDSSFKLENENDIKTWISNLEAENPVFINLFLVRNDGGLLSSFVSLDWNTFPESTFELNKKAAGYFNNAETAEFINKNYNEAIRLYQTALIHSTSVKERVLILSRIGRCRFKKGDYQEGIREYKRIIGMKNNEVTIGNVPANIVALTQVANGFKEMNAEKEHQEVLLELYSQLLYHPWDLQNGDYIYYLKSARRELEEAKLLNTTGNFNNPKIDELKTREHKLLQQIRFIESVHKDLLQGPVSEMNHNTSFRSAMFNISRNGYSNEPRIGFINLPETFQETKLLLLGYQFNKDYILNTLFPGILTSVDLGKDEMTGILGRNDSLLYMQHDQPITDYLIADDFSSMFAGWKVALFNRQGKTIEDLVGKEKHLYLILFSGIIIVMLIGTVVTVRAVIHETEVSRMKSEFVSNVSHELKTPLSLIRMFGETLDTGIVTDEKKRREFYSIIRKESERLTHLIDNVLDFSKMDTGAKKYYFEEADLVKGVKNSLEAYKFHIRENGFKIEAILPDEPVMLKIDRDAISQALLNLLSNAVKYSEERKYIQVKVEKDKDSALISVTDQGIGISRDQQKKIFEKFYQAPAAAEKEKQGSGLGLTLVKHIAEAHGGNVEVKSEPGRGSRFTIKIPLKPE